MTKIENRVADILVGAGEQASPLRPTELYNEGWMLRLVLDWSARNAAELHPFFFLAGARWGSEALLRSQFLPRFRRDPLSESWTHADGVIGHFSVSSGYGELLLESDARQFVVIEAKLFSPLSVGTKNAPVFDQAARNIACMAEVLRNASRRPEHLEKLAFVVIAPSAQIAAGVFGSLLTQESLHEKVYARVCQYQGAKDGWFNEWFEPTLKIARVRVIPWETVVPLAGPEYEEFYRKCLEYNRLMSTKPSSENAGRPTEQ